MSDASKSVVQEKKATLNDQSSKNILKVLNERECGLIGTYSFNDACTKVKVKQLSYIFEDFEVNPTTSCKFIRNNENSGLIGVWQKHMANRHSLVYHLKFKYCDQCELTSHEEWCPIVSDVSCHGPFFKRLDITDICHKKVHGRNLLVYVGNTAASGGQMVMNNGYDFDSNVLNNDQEENIFTHDEKPFFSCAVNSFSNIYAGGCENCYFVIDTQLIAKGVQTQGNVLALEFSQNGNSLYCGLAGGRMLFQDLRMYNSESAITATSFKRKAPRNVKEIKLLSDENSLIISWLNGEVCMFDLRMNREIFKYVESKQTVSRRSLSLDENLDLICSSNDDNKVRVWSLRTGELLNCFNPPRDKVSHACLISDHRRWFVALAQENLLTPLIPFNTRTEDIKNLLL